MFTTGQLGSRRRAELRSFVAAKKAPDIIYTQYFIDAGKLHLDTCSIVTSGKRLASENSVHKNVR